MGEASKTVMQSQGWDPRVAMELGGPLGLLQIETRA